ncbi:hypothetical protein O181_013939 [Austropuccinia psidii MF-1]|uniref:Uncharacterized protein n=1 Tax=Austropuccinia psidii MF-1 TaxID=1389203 RepID=A0A9Q3BXB1_9BASI|nr:hypothetical protein [Austropuccinia psidii MF-1]
MQFPGKKSNVQGIIVKDTSSKGKNKKSEETHSESDDDIDSHNYSEKNELSSGNDKVEEVVVVDKKVISSDAEIVLVKTELKPKKGGPKGSLPSLSVNVRDKGVLGTLEHTLGSKYRQMSQQLDYNCQKDERQSKVLEQQDEKKELFARGEEEKKRDFVQEQQERQEKLKPEEMKRNEDICMR